jgi:RNA-directed DNA polymerase
MADVVRHTEDWKTLPWKTYERNVFRLQQRIYQAMRRGDARCVRNLQRLLLRSWSARCLAVRQVSQDNRGKRTAGVDGVANLTPAQRLALAKEVRHLDGRPSPIRRVYIDKPNGEKRPLGIPTMADRARQALVKLALEPEWEAKFEPNSYGFRPGRSTHDAIEAIFRALRCKPKYVLDADIEKCFDRIDHAALLEKLKAPRPVAKLIRGWLKAGVLEQGHLLFPEAGTPQGGVISPLLANIALHGLERDLVNSSPYKNKANVIRYADDIVIIHPDLRTLQDLQARAEAWLHPMGLRLKSSKTHIVHTLDPYEGRVGFDFLGFTVRQFRVSQYRTATYRGKAGFKTIIKPSKDAQQRHLRHITQIIRQHRPHTQASLIGKLNPILRGWANYYRPSVAAKVYQRLDAQVYHQLNKWAAYRHRKKAAGWRFYRYWRRVEGRIVFSDGRNVLMHHSDVKIQRHIKVRGNKSPYDGDWTYWAARLGREPTRPKRVVELLKRQQGRCAQCGLRFMVEDVMEIHHRDHDHRNNRYKNLALLHGHCHDVVHRTERL